MSMTPERTETLAATGESETLGFKSTMRSADPRCSFPISSNKRTPLTFREESASLTASNKLRGGRSA